MMADYTQTEAEMKRDAERERDRCSIDLLVLFSHFAEQFSKCCAVSDIMYKIKNNCLLVAKCPSNMVVYFRDGSALTVVCADTLRSRRCRSSFLSHPVTVY